MPPSPHLERAYQLLADGEWHDYDKILTQVAAFVHPSQAYRSVVARRVTGPKDAEERAAMVRTGQREIARTILSRRERFERKFSDQEVDRIRLVPFKVTTPEEYSRSSKQGWETQRAKKNVKKKGK